MKKTKLFYLFIFCLFVILLPICRTENASAEMLLTTKVLAHWRFNPGTLRTGVRRLSYCRLFFALIYSKNIKKLNNIRIAFTICQMTGTLTIIYTFFPSKKDQQINYHYISLQVSNASKTC